MQPTELLYAFVLIFWAFIQILIFCELGKRVTDRFAHISDVIYFSEWYTFPKEIQQMLPTVLVAAQEPVVLQGFANLKCTRDSFKKVYKNSDFGGNKFDSN